MYDHFPELDSETMAPDEHLQFFRTAAAVEEVSEATGLIVYPHSLRLVANGWTDNPCRRPTAPYRHAGHDWMIFETDEYTGIPEITDETTGYQWVTAERLAEPAAIPARELAGTAPDPATAWDVLGFTGAGTAGLEPVWVWWLQTIYQSGGWRR